jgi:AcrR family transcriptional regulator
MARNYTLKRRADQQAQTRLRIVEAAVELHGTMGPAATSLSMVAEKAGVQRNTLYAHFPDEWSLLLGCSALALERDPLPDAEAWRGLAGAAERLRTGLGEVYGWYRRNDALTGCVLRDAEHHTLTGQVAALRFGPPMMAWREVLGAGLSAPQKAMLHLALGYPTWRALVKEAAVGDGPAVELMTTAIEGAHGPSIPAA